MLGSDLCCKVSDEKVVNMIPWIISYTEYFNVGFKQIMIVPQIMKAI